MIRAANDLFGFRLDVNCGTICVDYWRAGNADFGHDVGRADIVVGYRGDTRGRVDEADPPERRRIGTAGIIRVEGIDAVMLRRQEDHIVRALVWDRNVRQIERLGVNITIHKLGKQFTESVCVDSCWSEHGLISVQSGPRIVIVIGQHIALSLCPH